MGEYYKARSLDPKPYNIELIKGDTWSSDYRSHIVPLK